MKTMFVAKYMLTVVFAVFALLALGSRRVSAIDIGAMTWTPRADWINVKSCSSITGGPNAAGNGTTDDTAAIQDIFNYLQINHYGRILTVYFPAGTYKISSTLTLHSIGGVQMIGCGSNTIISWAGVSGGAMFWPNATGGMRYTGLVWNGNNLAGCAYEHVSSIGNYETNIRHENESFKNFTVTGNYSYTGTDGKPYSTTAPGTAIISGLGDAQVSGEVMFYNCAFSNCTNGIIDAYQTFQAYMWHIDGCEFENCTNGVNFANGGCYMVDNCHFQHSSNYDIVGGFNVRVRHCTSSGSNEFYLEGQDGSLGRDVFQDCWIDGWTGSTGPGPLVLGTYGAATVFDCTFTNPPSSAHGGVEEIQNYSQNAFSNNYAPNFPAGAGLIWYGSYAAHWDFIPGGNRTGTLTSASQTFLKTTWPADSTHILDVTQAPYNADPTFNNDSTAAIQAAIDAARTANNGSIVYIPCGLYRISSTLTVSGANYTIQGNGGRTQICWYAGSNNTMMTIASPQNIEIQQIHFSCLNNIPGKPGYLPTVYLNGVSTAVPTCDATTITGIKETASGASSAVYDDYTYDAYNVGNPGATGSNASGAGLLLSNLPAGSSVYIPHSYTPLDVVNCGAAQIFAKSLAIGEIHVSGTAPKTGFLGVLVAEGGQASDVNGYTINVTDDQNLVLGDYYSEQARNDVSVAGGSGTSPGRVTIQGMVSSAGANGNPGGLNGPTTSLNVDNYTGRVFYGSQAFSNNTGLSPVQITQTGSNPVDMILANTVFYPSVTMSLDAGANLIEMVNLEAPTTGLIYDTDNPNPLTSAAKSSIAQSYDHLRELEAADLNFEFGIQQLIASPSLELDPPNPAPATTPGYHPTGWTVVNDGALGSGVRNVTVAHGGSPFAAGSQSLLYTDTTGTTTGNAVYAYQTFGPSPASSPAVETFDFRCNPSGTHTDVWFVTSVVGQKASNVHIESNGVSPGYLGAGINGHDSFVANFLPGTWYRVQIVYSAPSSGNPQATLYLTPWNGNGAGVTTNYTIDGFTQGPATGGFTEVNMYSGAGVGSAQSLDLDNLSITTNSLLTIPANTGTQSGLVAHWSLDEWLGGTSYDSAGDSADGSWQNSPTFTSATPSAITFRNPGGLSFNGTNQSVFMGNPANLPSGYAPRTICGWGKASSTAAGYRWIASYGSPGASQAMFIGMNGTTLYGGGYTNDLTVPNFWDNKWHFIALTYDGTTAKLYADGTLVASGAKNWNLVPYACYIGEQVNNGNERWNGSIDDVRIYNRALSATEISSLAAGNP